MTFYSLPLHLLLQSHIVPLPCHHSKRAPDGLMEHSHHHQLHLAAGPRVLLVTQTVLHLTIAVSKVILFCYLCMGLKASGSKSWPEILTRQEQQEHDG